MSDLRKAAEMALEVLSHSLGHSNEAQEQIDKTKQALRQALAQPEQEPWTPVEIVMPDVVRHVFYSKFHSAPKREWVGLTDEERDWCINGTAWVGEEKEVRVKIVEAIEAKLKEKNA